MPSSEGPSSGRKTTDEYWDNSWRGSIRPRLPSPLNIGVRNLMGLLRRNIRKGDRYIELGCAPGKMLAWAASELGAEVSGIDFSPRGCESAAGLFRALGLQGDIRCEDLAANTFPPGSFDAVCSVGLVEHFDDPAPFIRQHALLARPGGRIVVAVPNYGGLLGRVQARLDPGNLAIHNLGVMSVPGLSAALPLDLVDEVRVFPYGRFSPWLLNLESRFPALVARAVQWGANFLAQLQPVTVAALAPLVVAEMRRRQ